MAKTTEPLNAPLVIAEPVTRRRRIIRRTVVLLLVLGSLALVLTMCSFMSVSSMLVAPTLRDIVGQHGTVSVHTRNAALTVAPRCDLTVEFAQGVTAGDVADVLSRVAPIEKYHPCDVPGAKLPSGSRLSVDADAWKRIDREGWEALGEKLTLAEPLSIRVKAEEPSTVSNSTAPALYGGFVQSVRDLAAGGPIEDFIAPVRWELAWSEPTGPRVRVRIDTSATPPAELADFLEAVTPLLDGRTSNVGTVTYSDEAGGAVLLVTMDAEDTAAEERIRDAFATVKLDGKLSFSGPGSAGKEVRS